MMQKTENSFARPVTMGQLSKLYKEVDTKVPCRKAATSNLGLQIGLCQTPLGNDGMWKMFPSTNTPANSALQKSSTCNTLIPQIEALNESDMCCRFSQLVGVQISRGSKSPND